MARASIENHVRIVLDAQPHIVTDDKELVLAVWRRIIGHPILKVSMGGEPFEAVSLITAMQLPSRASILATRRRLLRARDSNPHHAPWYATKD